jgi:hypothetical protein
MKGCNQSEQNQSHVQLPQSVFGYELYGRLLCKS